MVDSTREFGSSVKVERGRTKRTFVWNGSIKVAVKRKETALNVALGARGEITKGRCMEIYKKRQR